MVIHIPEREVDSKQQKYVYTVVCQRVAGVVKKIKQLKGTGSGCSGKLGGQGRPHYIDNKTGPPQKKYNKRKQQINILQEHIDKNPQSNNKK